MALTIDFYDIISITDKNKSIIAADIHSYNNIMTLFTLCKTHCSSIAKWWLSQCVEDIHGMDQPENSYLMGMF